MTGSFEMNEQISVENEKFIYELYAWSQKNNSDIITIIWNTYDKIVYCCTYFSTLKRNTSIESDYWYDYFPQYYVENIKRHFMSCDYPYKIDSISFQDTSATEECRSEYTCIIDRLQIEDEEYYICQLKDIGEMSELKEIIMDSEKLLSSAEFSAGLVHEIRNPLTSLKGFIQLVQAGITQKEKYYEVMIQEVEKLEKITSELLHMAKPFNENKTLTSVEEMIHDVLFLMNSQTTMKDINITLQLEADLHIYCNPSQIKQILINLIKNGAEAMKMKGNIQINTQQTDDSAIIEVIDHGEGIPADKIKEINKPFYSTKAEGTGLGLMIIQHILDKHQGQLEVSSQIAEITQFRLRFPLRFRGEKR